MNGSKARVAHEDRLVDGLAEAGQVILHYGDPSYARRNRDDSTRLPPAEALFLRIIAYLAFAESVCVPARYILGSRSTFDAITLARPLVEEGLVRPERRSEVQCCEELAERLGLPEVARRRGEWIDTVARSTRVFHSTELADYYRAILLQDLGPTGGLRTALRKDILRASLPGLERAHEAYAAVTDGTPEAYWRTVAEYAPRIEPTARQWAMARYYITPTKFDTLNTREVPRSAADLLIRGKVLDEAMRPLDLPAPAEAMFTTLSMHLPAHDARARARDYCEAVLEVRGRVPRAREIFSDVQRRAELSPISTELAQLMREELDRQRGIRRSSGTVFTVMASLAGTGLGWAVGNDPGVGLATGVAGGVASNAVQNRLQDSRERKKRPWVVAIDYMTRDAIER